MFTMWRKTDVSIAKLLTQAAFKAVPGAVQDNLPFGTPTQIRTETVHILSVLPLPIGVWA